MAAERPGMAQEGNLSEEPIKVVSWVSGDDLADRDDVGCLGGFFLAGMRWRDYVRHSDLPNRYAEAMREEILRRKLRVPGEWRDVSDDPAVPVFSDGKHATFSWRAWGDLMAAVWSEADAQDYGYMDFYMYGWGRAQHDSRPAGLEEIDGV